MDDILPEEEHVTHEVISGENLVDYFA